MARVSTTLGTNVGTNGYCKPAPPLYKEDISEADKALFQIPTSSTNALRVFVVRELPIALSPVCESPELAVPVPSAVPSKYNATEVPDIVKAI